MTIPASFIELTLREHEPGTTGRILVSVANIASVQEVHATGPFEKPGTMVVLRELSDDFVPWAFQTAPDTATDATMQHPGSRRIHVFETYEVLQLLVRWANDQPGVYSRADYDAFLKPFSEGTGKPIPVGPPATFDPDKVRQRRSKVPKNRS